jgi:hypothetical protein
MSTKKYNSDNQANESISKYKMISAYGGPGSLLHTSYGSIIVSCIEEWGFLQKIILLHEEEVSCNTPDKDISLKVAKKAALERNGKISISNDTRLLRALISRKGLVNLRYLTLIPDIELNGIFNIIKNNLASIAINSSFMPKNFLDNNNYIQSYNDWYKRWLRNGATYEEKKKFFLPSYRNSSEIIPLKQDNLVLICKNGHISDFPWAKFLSWKHEVGFQIEHENVINLFGHESCCGNAEVSTAHIKILSNNSNAPGFDGKRIRCEKCGKQVSLKGIMNLKVKCPGHKPWEAKCFSDPEQMWSYSGVDQSRRNFPPSEKCEPDQYMKVVLSTGNNLYYARSLSSIFFPERLFLSNTELEIAELEKLKKEALNNEDYARAEQIKTQIVALRLNAEQKPSDEALTEQEKDLIFRHQEYKILATTDEEVINDNYGNTNLVVKDVTANLDANTTAKYFSRILRIDNMKLTTAQLDFTRDEPLDENSTDATAQDIFRSSNNDVIVYPVVENYGEGIFMSFDYEKLKQFEKSSDSIAHIRDMITKVSSQANSFSRPAITRAEEMNWQIYVVHTFTHLLIRELEFRCGYPTASLSERIYVSNDEKYKMYGVLIFTAEGNEGSMGGLIAQTTQKELNKIILSALKRAQLCSSDPLCWHSDGQGLFDLNFAACFSCGLVSETTCEHRNIYLDRRILVDEKFGYFKELL